MKVIGIAGKAESGKTTLAMILKRQLEDNHKRVLLINYGDFVKFIATKYYNWNGEKDENGRALLQHIGTEQGRMGVDQNIWVDMVINTVLTANRDYDIAIVADCRFPNEFDRWKERGQKILKIKIVRPEHNNKLTKEQKNHLSEISLDNYKDWDLVISNIGSFEDLEKQIKAVTELIVTN